MCLVSVCIYKYSVTLKFSQKIFKGKKPTRILNDPPSPTYLYNSLGYRKPPFRGLTIIG